MENPPFKFSKWLKIALFNFLITALAGILLRYQSNFPMASINYIFLLHSHSHFAFTGWVSLALMSLMINYLSKEQQDYNSRKYEWILIANTFSAYGMLITFVLQGYALYSITFSTLSIFVSYVFIWVYWKDLTKASGPAVKWFKTAMILCGLSSLGAFTMAFFMAKHIQVQEYNLAAIYFYLHFQYNGWFIFVCLGLLFAYLDQEHNISLPLISRNLYTVLAIAVVPSYLLSLSGMDIVKHFSWILTATGILQLFALYDFGRLIRTVKTEIAGKLGSNTLQLWTLAAISFILKLVLQFLPVIPWFTSYATGFRPIAIAYLHLIFLGIVSFFIIGYINEYQVYKQGQLPGKGTYIFIAGVFIQETILMLQGLTAMWSSVLPHANLFLLFSAIIIGSGISIIAYQAVFCRRQI
ncbi:MAG: hypothetical protein ABWY16_04110 [Pedobacter sp.]|uniref:hypothetical protein n=1 Tax=Pedobacter sp. TaxID=1411316 RepID=UPI003399BF8A